MKHQLVRRTSGHRLLGRTLSAVLHSLSAVTFLLAAGTVGTLAWFNVHHQQLLVVTSGSMVPTFDPGDLVAIEKPQPQLLRPGRVITFDSITEPGHLTTHRIRAVVPKPYGLFFQTKGDANPTADPNLTSVHNVHGVMTQVLPSAGRWLVFYQSPRGRALILGAPLLLLLLSQSMALVRDFRRRQVARIMPVVPRQHVATAPAGTEATDGSAAEEGAELGSSPGAPAPGEFPTRSARRAAESTPTAGPGRRLVVSSLLAVCAVSVAAGVGIARHTNAVYTQATPVGANTLGTRQYCPDTLAYKSAVQAASPLLYYRFDESGGTTATNSGSAASSPATYVSFQASEFGARGALRCDESQPGIAETAVRFDGSDDYVVSSASGNVGKTEPISAEAWFLTTPGSQGGLIVGRCNQNGNRDSDRLIYLTPGGRVAFGLGSASPAHTLMTSGGSLADGQWHHVVATADGSTMALYVDGLTVASQAYSNANNGQGTWQVGWDDPDDLGPWPSSPSTHFLGSIDEVAIYPVALSPTQVADHWSQAHYKP